MYFLRLINIKSWGIKKLNIYFYHIIAYLHIHNNISYSCEKYLKLI